MILTTGMFFFKKHFKEIPKITGINTFRFSVVNPGIVQIKRSHESSWESIRLLKKPRFIFPSNSRPSIVIPDGLDLERQTYLFKEIRGFVRNPKRRDITCPKP